MHALSAFEQVALQQERDDLYAELLNLFRVFDSADWSPTVVHIIREHADTVFDRAEKTIAKYKR